MLLPQRVASIHTSLVRLLRAWPRFVRRSDRKSVNIKANASLQSPFKTKKLFLDIQSATSH